MVHRGVELVPPPFAVGRWSGAMHAPAVAVLRYTVREDGLARTSKSRV